MRLLVSLSAWLYERVLLVRYPRDLRRRYGREMADLFRADLQERAAARGLWGFAEGWRRLAVDWARPLPRPPGNEPGTGRVRRTTSGGGGTMGGWGRGSWEDVGFAWRALRREPGFTGLVVAVLGAGIALNAAVFAVVSAYMVRPLPYPEADRVVSLRSPVEITWDDAEGVLETRVTWDLDVFTIVGDGRPRMARGAWVTPDFLDTYGVVPVLGRNFLPDERGPDAASVALISWGLWQERYGGDPDVLGRTFSAFTSDRPDDAETFTVVGVLPPGFWHFNDYTEVLAPLRSDRQIYAGRLARGMPPERAERILADRVAARLPTLPEGPLVQVVRQREAVAAAVRPSLLALQSAVFLVFVIACANAAVLLLVRSAHRERELGVRRALGAGGPRLARQLVGEGAILSGAAGAVGLLVGGLLLDAARTFSALTLWRTVPGGADALRLDGTVVAAAAVLCGLTAVVFGLVPLVAAGGRDLVGSLVGGGRGGSETSARRRARNVMVGAEIALSLALLTGAGLMVRSAVNVQARDLGFDPARVVRGQMGLRQASYPEPEARVGFFDRAVEAVAALPAVESVGLVSSVPFMARYGTEVVESEEGTRADAVVRLADGGYFRTLEIPLVRGRVFSRDDVRGADGVVVVSESLAGALWPGAEALGRRLRQRPVGMDGLPAEPGPWNRVVGVVADVQRDVGGPGGGDVYGTVRQSMPLWLNAVVRVREGATAPVGAIEAALAEIDPSVPFADVRELAEAVDAATAPSRFLAVLFGGFAALAMLLAVVGLYGVMAYAARQSRRDVAIRMAMGANAGAVRGHFFRQALLVLALGLGAGVVGGRVVGLGLAPQLYGVEPGDPATALSVLVLLGATALAAVWLPARRAATVEPMAVLREE